MNDYYALLSLDLGCPEDDIRKAIHRELRTWTNRTNAPDLQRKQEAERRIKLLDEADAILLDPAKRANYDRELGRQTKVETAPELGETDNPAEEARRLLEDGRVADALYLAQKASEADPRDPEIWWILGRANHEFGETDRAVKYLKRAIAIRPDQPKYQFDLGNIYESSQDWPLAAQCYERAYQVDQNVLMYLAAYGAMLVKMGQYAVGIEALEECVRQEPENSTYQWFLAIAYADGAQVGWTQVGEGHSLLESGAYATEIEQVTVAQQALAKALALNFDDAELTAQLTSVKKDIDSMTKRRFVGSWFVPAVFVVSGLFPLVNGSLLGLINVFLGSLYAISLYIPQYIVNRQLVREKSFNDFEFIGKISDFFLRGTENGVVNLIAWAIQMMVIILLVPFLTVYNLYRYQGDTIRGWLTSAENKQKITTMMNRLQGAANGTVAAATDVLSNLKFPERADRGEEEPQSACESRKTKDTGSTCSPASQRSSVLDRGSDTPSVPEQDDERQKLGPIGAGVSGTVSHLALEHKDSAREPTALAGSKLLDIFLARKKLIALGIGLALVIVTTFFGNLHFRDENRSITAASDSRSLSSESGVSAEAKSSMQSRGGQTAAALSSMSVSTDTAGNTTSKTLAGPGIRRQGESCSKNSECIVGLNCEGGVCQKPGSAEVPSLSQPVSRTAPEKNSVTKAAFGAHGDRCTEHFECGGGLKCETGVCMERSEVTEATGKAETQSKPPSQSARDAEREAWKAAVAANRVTSYEAYLKEYPSGRHSSAARMKLARLHTELTPRPSRAVVLGPVPPVSAAETARPVEGYSKKAGNTARYVDTNGCLREANGSFVIGFRSDCK
jgi:predicted Zn-dependent protease